MRELAFRRDLVDELGEAIGHVAEGFGVFWNVRRLTVGGKVDDDKPMVILQEQDNRIPCVPTVDNIVNEDHGGAGSGNTSVQRHALSVALTQLGGELTPHRRAKTCLYSHHRHRTWGGGERFMDPIAPGRASIAPEPSYGLAVSLRPILMRLDLLVRRQNSKYTLSRAQTSILKNLATHGDLRMSDLAKLENVRVPTTSNSVTVIEERGYAERVRDSQDRRGVSVRLTEKGRNRINRVLAARDQDLATRLMSLPQAQRDALTEAVPALNALLDTYDYAAPRTHDRTTNHTHDHTHVRTHDHTADEPNAPMRPITPPLA